MFIGHFKMLAEIKGFYFAYDKDENKCLTKIIWADKEGINNYKLYGDTILFYPTYGTNKYFMVFTLFTGVNHNKKTVTFAAGLLEFESQESFEWIFTKFLEAMGQHQPQCIITDQCPGIKKACPNIFKNSVHKYYMWHIMQKVPEKVGRAICNDTNFMTDINVIVWDVDLEPEEFEQLENRCLMRTTQRSESSNSYFKRFESHFGTLVEFWMRYNSAIEQQRHSQRQMDTTNEHSMLEKVGPMKVEMHASLVYTHPIFADFQKEVKHAICSMRVGGLTTQGIVEYHDVRAGLKHRNFRVEFFIQTNESKCACKLFERRGIVCGHILWVWNGRQVYKIPEPYVLARWTKKSYRPIVQDETGKVIEDIDEADIKKAEMSKVWSEIYANVRVMDMVKQMKQLQKTLK
ncbi:protein FAR1-RELATED SEQUENCE 5-like [Silene latifolia]|uniref:protein FAR1-RELATED SEQUENCE 5-like n=1 Tax=Silene latifolia TaxID=37657 RepID=UPI003D7729EF